MIPIENWTIILIAAFSILIAYTVLYKLTLKNKLHNLTEEHKVDEPHNDLSSLKSFIENCWSKGYSIPEIKSILMEKGWNEDTIDKVFYKSKIPNEEQNTSRIKRLFNVKPKEPQTQIRPKQQTKVTPKSTKKDIKTNIAPQQEETIGIGEDPGSADDGYKESDEVTRLKKEILKDVKKD